MSTILTLINILFMWCMLYPSIYCAEDVDNEIQTSNEEEPLLLTPLIQDGKYKEAQKAAEVTEIEEMKDMKSYSGFLTVNKKYNSNMFFWFVLSQDDPENDPLVLWLQGGPGRSSLRGLLMENGPFDIGPGGLTKRPASWTQNHSVIYLDNPVGSGFSHANLKGYHSTLSGIGEDLYIAVQQFFQLFPQFQKHDFYIAGQSYGGKYVPTLAHIIHERNANAASKIKLRGIAIGNGLVDPETQFHYSDFLYQIGLINYKSKKNIESYEQNMTRQIKNKDYTAAYTTYIDIILNARDSLVKRETGFRSKNNMLEPIPTPEKEVLMDRYLAQAKIKKSIHAGKVSFFSHSDIVQYFLLEDLVQSVAPLVSVLIDNYRVLIYNGQLDIIIPYRTTVDYLKKLTFKGVENYEDADRHHWYVNGVLAGYATHVGNLTELMVRNAGHSVTEDQIVWATDMLYRFTRNISFDKQVGSA